MKQALINIVAAIVGIILYVAIIALTSTIPFLFIKFVGLLSGLDYFGLTNGELFGISMLITGFYILPYALKRVMEEAQKQS